MLFDSFIIGANKECLEVFYRSLPDALDKDYLRLFPQSNETPAEAEEEMDEVSSVGSGVDMLDFDDEEIGDVSEEEGAADHGVSVELQELELSDYRLDQLKLEEQLTTNINAQQLQKIYNIVTQEQQER